MNTIPYFYYTFLVTVLEVNDIFSRILVAGTNINFLHQCTVDRGQSLVSSFIRIRESNFISFFLFLYREIAFAITYKSTSLSPWILLITESKCSLIINMNHCMRYNSCHTELLLIFLKSDINKKYRFKDKAIIYCQDKRFGCNLRAEVLYNAMDSYRMMACECAGV